MTAAERYRLISSTILGRLRRISFTLLQARRDAKLILRTKFETGLWAIYNKKPSLTVRILQIGRRWYARDIALTEVNTSVYAVMKTTR